MDAATFWKNFRIGEELHIAGRFLFNGLRCCHEMESFHHEDEVFELLYHVSVGLERLLKVAVVMAEHDDTSVPNDFEKSLITHTHSELLTRVKSKHNLSFGSVHNEFLQLLATFYRSQRYGRFNVRPDACGEKEAVRQFIEKHLALPVHDDFPFDITPNSTRIRRFFGRVIGKISTELFTKIQSDASRLNIFTDEIRPSSKAAKVFLDKEFTFENEDILVKELILHFLTTDANAGHLGLLKQLAPLGFDPGLDVEHIQALLSDEKKIESMGELEALYDDIKDKKARLQILDLVGQDGVCLDSDEEDDEDVSC